MNSLHKLALSIACFSSVALAEEITFDVRAYYVTIPFDVGKPQKVTLNGGAQTNDVCNAYRRSLAEAGATTVSGLALNDKGDILRWDSTAALPDGVVCIASSDGVANGSTIAITEPEPLQYLAKREDGRYDLREMESGTFISLRYWANNISMAWISSRLAHRRVPMEGVALDAGPPDRSIFAKFAINTPPNEWRDYIVFDPKTADGARILVFIRMRASPEAISAANAGPSVEQYSFEFQIMRLPRKSSAKFLAAIETDPAFTVFAGEAQRIVSLDSSTPFVNQIAGIRGRSRDAKDKDVELISAPRVTVFSERTICDLTLREPEIEARGKITSSLSEIFGELATEPRPGRAIIADIFTQGKEWSGIACLLVANPGPTPNMVNAAIAPVVRSMVDVNNYVECGFRADVTLTLGKPEWYTFADKATSGTILVRVTADAVPPEVSHDFFYR